MFDEGSPKASHGWLVVAGAAAAAAMFLASFGAEITYRASGREITLTEGPALAQIVALVIPLLLIGWRRGHVDGQWPLVVCAACAIFALLFLAGDWLTAWQGSGTELRIPWRYYVTMAGAAVLTALCIWALRVPVVERSESSGNWVSRSGGRR